jgi:hypothetical protein
LLSRGGNNLHLVAAKLRALSVVIAESDETPTDSPERSATVSFFLEIYEMLVILPRCFSSTSRMLLRLQIEAVGMFASIKGGNIHLAFGQADVRGDFLTQSELRLKRA